MSNQIQNKLSQFEVQPPEGVWNRVAAALDEQTLFSAGEKISQFEVSPNENIWNKIDQQLDDVAPARIIPIRKKNSPVVKYGMAAAAIIAIALVGTLLISKKTDSEPPIQSIAKKQINNPAKENDQTSFATAIASSRVADEGEIPQTEYSKYVVHKKTASQVSPTLIASATTTEDIVPKIATRNSAIYFNDDSDKYMAYSMEDGNAVKLPKKMYDAITCPTKDVACLQKIRQLQEKMAASALSADFTGVLDILNNLGENQ